MTHHSRPRVRRRSKAGRYVALLPLAAVAVAAYLARNHHPATPPAAGAPTVTQAAAVEPGPELEAFSVEDYEPEAS